MEFLKNQLDIVISTTPKEQQLVSLKENVKLT